MAGPDDPTGPQHPVGAAPVGPSPRKRPVWLIPLLLLLAVAALLLLSRCGGDDEDPDASGATPTATATTPATAADPTASPSADPSADPGAGGGSGTITVGDRTLLPLSAASGAGAGDLGSFADEAATGTAVEVQAVPSDEGFWVGEGAEDRVWVQLTGAEGESPFKVAEGDRVSFTGTVTPAAAGFTDDIGLTGAEGAELLTSQGHYISVPRGELTRAG